jgi:hypothetical protein
LRGGNERNITKSLADRFWADDARLGRNRGLSEMSSELATILSERWSADVSAFLVVARSFGDPLNAAE